VLTVRRFGHNGGVRVQIAGESGHPERPSEDYAAATQEALVVVDGSSAPPGMESGCRHGTAWYARRLGVHLLARLVDRPDRGMAQCLGDAIAETAALHGARCDLAHPNTPAAMVVAVRLRGPVLEYLALGDSVLVLDLPSGARVVGDNQPFPAGEQLRTRLWAATARSPERAALREEYALALRAARNTGRGPWVAAALPRAAEHAETGSVRRGEVRGIAALTDGAARYVERFALGTWPEALALMASHGPEELIRRVRSAEAADPECVRWPRESHHDDATAVWVAGW
jgi:hypothetical protein